MKLFTLCDGRVEVGAKVVPFKLSNGTIIPSIQVGETGRGRKLGVLAVSLLPDAMLEFEHMGCVTIQFATIGKTFSGNPKLIQTPNNMENGRCVCILRTPIGYRGSNQHLGDIDSFKEKDGATQPAIWKKFPGEIVVDGYIAEGGAGRMGGGNQYVAIIPIDTVFCTSYSGRRYGNPYEHYWKFDGETVECATWQDRVVADLWMDKLTNSLSEH